VCAAGCPVDERRGSGRAVGPRTRAGFLRETNPFHRVRRVFVRGIFLRRTTRSLFSRRGFLRHERTWLPAEGPVHVQSRGSSPWRFEAKEKAESAVAMDPDQREWAERCLRDFESIRKGITRGEVAGRFALDG